MLYVNVSTYSIASLYIHTLHAYNMSIILILIVRFIGILSEHDPSVTNRKTHISKRKYEDNEASHITITEKIHFALILWDEKGVNK